MAESVFEKYKGFFSPQERTASEEPGTEDDEIVARAEKIRDMRVFISTKAYSDFRATIEREILKNEPDPMMGSDVVACCTFKQQGLRQGLRELDHMVRLAEEKLADE